MSTTTGMLDAIWPAVGQTWAANLRIFGEAPEFVVLYEHEHSPCVERPRMLMAERIRFENNRIAEIEVFVGRELPPLQAIDKKLRTWKPETEAAVRARVAEVIELADHSRTLA